MAEENDAPVSSVIYHLDANDPGHELLNHPGMTDADLHQINALMTALGRLRDAEQQLADASLKYLKLNNSDMRALHYLVVSTNRGVIATPGAIAAHLKISTASTTKLLDRLERAGHVTRKAHPSDRRALAIAITPETHDVAMRTVGRRESRRFLAAARLTPAERNVVIHFLDDMAAEIALGLGAPAADPSGDRSSVQENRQPVPVVRMHQGKEKDEVKEQVD